MQRDQERPGFAVAVARWKVFVVAEVRVPLADRSRHQEPG
jgi:hypothetical protein